MNNNSFCHLHLHDEHSLLDGLGKPEQYAKKASELGFKYLSVTNHGLVDGLIKHQKACEKYDITPIFGVEGYIVPDLNLKQKGEKRGHITLLVKNEVGWSNLLKIMTIANLDGYYYRPRFDFPTLLDHIEGLIVLTGCQDSFLLLGEKESQIGLDLYCKLVDRAKDDVYLEVMPHITQNQERLNKRCLDLSMAEGGSLVATNDCHYVSKGDEEAQEVLLAIQRKAKWTDKDRWKFDLIGLHLRTANEMISALKHQGVLHYKEISQAMRETINIAEKCSDFRIKRKKVHLPPVYEDTEKSDFVILDELCMEAFSEKITGKGQDIEKYMERYTQESSLIAKLDFSRYFLIVHELIQWCKQNNIMTGPNRGSAGGSLVTYLLGITSVDPIEYGLVFSRFISPDRIDLPDIDMDFEDIKRPLIRKHLEELYGKHNVAGVSTFMKMKDRGALRDVSRVFNVSYFDVDKAAKAIPYGSDLEAAFDGDCRWFEQKYPDVARLSMILDDQVRGSGQHAAALVVSGSDLRSGTNAVLAKRSNSFVVNWDKDDAEYMGLMKIDILGLAALSVLNEAKRLIKMNTGTEIDFESLDVDDPRIYDEFSLGNTVGCFQMNSFGMTRLCRDLGIDDFEMLVAANALYRPGTLRSGTTDEFIRRKRGRVSWEFSHDIMEEITEKTYGIVLYQEQVMELVVKLAGFSWGDADRIRKIMGKSKGSAEFLKFGDDFIVGCEKQNTLSKRGAKKLWEDLASFGEYGFNRSHSVGYSMISAWDMWLKVHYPVEFISASLSFGSQEKKEDLIKEGIRLGLDLVLPKVGLSDPQKWVAEGGKLYMPFIEIKGLGEKTAAQAATLKKKATTKGFFTKMEESKKTGSKLENILNRIGAFDRDKKFSGDELAEIGDLFSFTLPGDSTYPRLRRLLGIKEVTGEALQGSVTARLARTPPRFRDKKLLDCIDCELRQECDSPVMPSTGRYNIVVVGEAPGRDENSSGVGFIGVAGRDILWPELKVYGLDRGLFYITNIVKCWPSKSKTPVKKHLDACSKWFKMELNEVKPFLILALGNTCRKFFVDTGGITDVNGTTEWLEQWGAWICWCIHPASVLYDSGNRTLFEKGIENFSEKLEILGGI